MFDPSKLDFDLDKKKEKKVNLSEKEIKSKQIIETDNNISEKIKEPINEDILGNLNEPIEKNDDSNSKENKLIIETENKIEEKQIGRTEYEQTIAKEPIDNLKSEEKKEEEKIIFDINITSLNIFIEILIEKEYDFATFEPTENYIKIVFRKNKAIAETRFIKFPTYTNILLKAKSVSKLTIEETENQQEGEGEIVIKNKNYKIVTKVVPSPLGSKLFIKAQTIEKKVIKKVTKKTSISQIFTFLGAIAFISLIIGGGFISFIVVNAKTIEDVKFFASLGINLNDINTFIGQAIAIIFSVLIFIETLFLVIYLFKFALTKKEYKKKKIRYGIIATLVLLITFITGTAWMIIDEKIRALPNWQEMASGDIQLYDNSKLISDSFEKEGSLLNDTSNLIGPVEIKFDLSFLEKKENRKGLKITKYFWDFGDGKKEETTIPTIIHNFIDKGNYEIKLTIEEVDLQGEVTTKEVDAIKDINLLYSVKINEKRLSNGGKLVDFNATPLKELGKIEWYFMESLEKPIHKGETFVIGKPIFEETLIGMYIRRNDKESETLDKIFIINGETQTNLDGKITSTRGIINDLEYEFKVDNLANDFGNGYIEEFKWIIGDIEIIKKGDIDEPTKSSTTKHIFEFYGEHKIKVILKDSSGETKEIIITIDIPKKIHLSNILKIYNDDELVDVKYEKKLNEYYIDSIGIPTKIKLDARLVRSKETQYRLKKVSWDYDSDGDIDKVNRTGEYAINLEGNHTITVYFEFVNKKISTDTIELKELIFIEGLKKDAIIKFDIKKDNSYVPIIVSFDASKSMVNGENISKFIWDYGDGVTEERDAIVPGHRYTTPGDYEIKLKVVTVSGKEYSATKKLILTPKPQSVKITSSLKKAPVGQGIDFISEESEGQITGYFWDFGDGQTSTQANPSHSYRKKGIYDVKLTIDFSNRNILEDKMEIEIFEY